MALIIDNAISTVVPGLTNSSPTGAITKIPTRNFSKSTITIIATIIKIIVQSVPSIFSKNYINNGLYRCTNNLNILKHMPFTFI
jgi:hypothetical protein